MKRLFLFYSLFVTTSLTLSKEYLYPIVNLDDSNILVMHQKSLDSIELLSFNSSNNTFQKLLSSLYLPAYVKLVPGKKKYSFIHNGRIYIKSFSKRTPRGIDMYQPICDIQSLQWVSDHECVFSAKYKNHYKIFMYDLHKEGGTLYALGNLNDAINYIFPSCIENSLFCLIQKGCNELYEIAQLEWNPIPFDEALNGTSSSVFIKNYSIQHTKPLCFLVMNNQTQGYAIEIVEHNKEGNFFTFGCCRIDLQQESLTSLFEFQIPEHFIIGQDENRFFESIYPLLPNYTKDIIYFTHYNSELKRLTLHQYNLADQTIVQIPAQTKKFEDRHMFSPLIINGHMYLGHNIESESLTL